MQLEEDHQGPHLNGKHLRPESLMMSYGYNPEWSEMAVKAPIYQTSTFVFKNAEEGKAFFELAYGLRQANPEEEIGLIYSRLNNPSIEILEDRLTLWDGASVFDVGGNKFRLIAKVSYEKGKVYVLRVLTHKQYDAKKWKADL